MVLFKRFGFLSLLFLATTLNAGSVRMLNDSPYKLRAVIRANDNTFLGELIITSQNNGYWDDSYQGLPGSLESVRAQTPYRVLWYCLDGSAFSVCDMVNTGATVTASSGVGARQCRGKSGERQQEGVQPSPSLPLPGQGYGPPVRSEQQYPQQQQQGQYPQQQGQQQVPPYPQQQQEYQNPPNQYPQDSSQSIQRE